MPSRGGRAGRVLGWLVVVGLLVGVVVVVMRSESISRMVTGPDCVVQTAEGEVDLDRDQARRATSAVAVAGRGVPAPDTSDIDGAVMDRLMTGPPDDAGPSLQCRGTGGPRDLSIQEIAETGLTPRAQAVLEEMEAVFGQQSLGGFAPGGVQRVEESTHNDGRAIDVFYRPVSEENRREGWLLAHWLVAHAEELHIQYVIFDDRFWYDGRRGGTWQDYRAPAPANEILRHLDHVHVDVWRGE